MHDEIILASGSEIRSQLLTQAKVAHRIIPAKIDEETVTRSLQHENATPRDIADTLAELKAQRIGFKYPSSLVIGCDQVLAADNKILSKPRAKTEAVEQLKLLRGKKHQLLSAAVIYHGGQPQWRSVGVVRLHMHDISDVYLGEYVDRNWPGIRDAVGAYKLEQEGVRLFSRIEGDYFNVLGLPLLDLLSYLRLRGTLPS